MISPVLTLGQEIELIWRQRWSLMTVLYLVVRTSCCTIAWLTVVLTPKHFRYAILEFRILCMCRGQKISTVLIASAHL
ncbi:hypothetical protein C8R48DRAFT_735259 [Suillus tomentosus]|nr:hypothetical protein C8R48DRAFT_735259 [Suillus tomentosus]